MRRLLVIWFAFCFAVTTALLLAQPGSSQSSGAQAGSSAAEAVERIAQGTGGAVASVDALATQIGIATLRSGGNAVDAAVAAALGVTEPFSAGIGGGGFMVIYRPKGSPENAAENATVITLDGREEAPAAVTPYLFQDPESAAESLYLSSLIALAAAWR